MNRLAFVIVITALMNSGCVIVSELNNLTAITTERSLSLSSGFEAQKLVYVHELRCYTYDGVILLRKTGEKIRTKSGALEHLQVAMTGKVYSKSEKAFGVATLVYGFPVGLTLAAINTVALIPIYPYTHYLLNTLQRESFDSYVLGSALLRQGRYEDARLQFLRTMQYALLVTQQSDVYFKIAETYDGEGNREQASAFYVRFLDYSTALYPAFFLEYDGSYRNDLSALAGEFDEAEKKIAENNAGILF